MIQRPHVVLDVTFLDHVATLRASSSRPST
jgi:hypothetical protein